MVLPQSPLELAGVIYLLSDPRDGSPKYVGKTVRKLRIRMYGHRQLALRPTKHTAAYSTKWLKFLYTNGMEPVVTVLEVVPLGADQLARLNAREAHYISVLLAAGHKLCNHTPGGDGGSTSPGRVVSPEERALISAANKKEANPERARKISESKKRQWQDPEYRAKMLEAGERGRQIVYAQARGRPGRPHTEETKQKLRAARLGTTMSPETRAKISETLKSMPEKTHPPGWAEKIRATRARRRAAEMGDG